MNLKSKKLPQRILVIGLVLIVITYLITAIKMKPTVTEYDFDYSATYKLNGETITIDGVYRVEFNGFGRDSNPTARYYTGSHLQDDGIYPSGAFTIDTKDGYELRIVTIFTDRYLMGDGDKFFTNEIYLAAYDDMGSEYVEPEILGKFDAELISYELPTPIENSFTFAGFSVMHDISMFVMLGVGYLVLIVCMIFVKRDDGITYNALDVISIVFNFIISIVVIPFITTIAYWSQIVVSVYDFIYQINLCLPVISVLAVAVSLCLRRKGYRKSGFFVQFAGVVLFALSLIIDYTIY